MSSFQIPRLATLPAVLAAVSLLGACGAMPGAGSSEQAAAPAASSAPATKPSAGTKAAPADASKSADAGSAQKVKGINGFEGEITGKPAAGSKFTRLQIGMPMKQVMDLIGTPTDSGAYVTGKAFIPFYFGSDRHRFEMVYKGQGRLIFAGESMGTGGNLIWIIHNASESGYR